MTTITSVPTSSLHSIKAGGGGSSYSSSSNTATTTIGSSTARANLWRQTQGFEKQG